tara:strand:+ start:86 stop:892 length:807 start_codon:yes stop_codon:yes gene_type:complete
MKSIIKKIIPFSLGKKLRGIYQRFLGIYYFGKRFTCPYCGNTFRKMLPGGSTLPKNAEMRIIGGGRRNNCVCPRCYATDRDRLIYLYLNQHSDFLEKELKVLHVAPSGSLKAFIKRQSNISYQEGIKYHEGFYYAKDIAIIDITNLSFEDNSFDVIFCNHVLEHVIEDNVAMKELHRVLKPNGWAILQVPISAILEETFEDFSKTTEKEREEHFGQFDHVRIYGSDYKDRLADAGFKVDVIHPEKDWKSNNFEKYAINKEEKLYVVHK